MKIVSKKIDFYIIKLYVGIGVHKAASKHCIFIYILFNKYAIKNKFKKITIFLDPDLCSLFISHGSGGFETVCAGW